MSNLNKIKEEGENKLSELRELTKEIESLTYQIAFCKNKNISCIKELALKDIKSEEFNTKLLDWHNKQMDKAFSLAIDEVVEEIEEMSTGITINSYTELVKKTSYLEALDSLKQKLLSLKNK